MISAWMTLILLVSTTPLVQTGGTVTVDCDAGESLDSALRHAEAAGEGRIRISGVCRGNYTFSGAKLRLEAGAPGATLQSRSPGGGTVLEIRGAESAVLVGLHVVDGGIGVRVSRTDALAVLDTEFKGNELGLYLEQGTDAFLSEARFIKNTDGGLAIRTGANASVNDSVFVANGRIGVSLLENAGVALNDSQISGHTSAGLYAWILSSANVRNCDFSENGDAHIAVIDRSRVNLVTEVTLGADGDTTAFSVFVDNQSSLSGFSATTFFGDVISEDAAYVALGAIEVHGSFIVSDFGRVNLWRTEVDGSIVCSSGGDAVCRQTGSLPTSGCASAPADCASPLVPPADGTTESPVVTPFPSPGRFRIERESGGAAGDPVAPGQRQPGSALERK